MIAILLLVPLFAVVASLFMYQLNGKKEIIRLDVVQFFYAFVLAPILYVWSKTLLFVLLRTDPEIQLSGGQLFVIDTFFSVLFLFIFAFIVMHSVTKSINLKVYKDPLHDIFQHSEYFHLWISHLVIYVGTGIIFTILSMVNVFTPLDFSFGRPFLFTIVGLGGFMGLLGFMGIWLSDPKQHKVSFLRLMKLANGILFLIHGAAYFIFEVRFTAEFSFYWWSSAAFATLVMALFFAHRSERTLTFTERIANWLKHQGWDTRIQLFSDKKH